MNEEMTVDKLLSSAARLVDRALAKMNTTSVPCRTCGHHRFAEFDEAKVFEQLANVPEKLRQAATRLGAARMTT